MSIELGVHDADKLLQSQQLFLHSALVSVEVLFLLRISAALAEARSLTNHAIHDLDETPESHLFVAAHDDVDRST